MNRFYGLLFFLLFFKNVYSQVTGDQNAHTATLTVLRNFDLTLKDTLRKNNCSFFILIIEQDAHYNYSSIDYLISSDFNEYKSLDKIEPLIRSKWVSGLSKYKKIIIPFVIKYPDEESDLEKVDPVFKRIENLIAPFRKSKDTYISKYFRIISVITERNRRRNK